MRGYICDHCGVGFQYGEPAYPDVEVWDFTVSLYKESNPEQDLCNSCERQVARLALEQFNALLTD